MTTRPVETRVELRLGGEWPRTLTWLTAAVVSAGLDRDPDPAHLLDLLDFVIGDDNLTALLGEEPVLLVLDDLLGALLKLTAGERRKVIVPLRRAPFELVLTAADPTTLAVSLYGVAPGSPVLAHDRPVAVAALVEAVEATARELVIGVAAQSAALAASPLLRAMAARLAALAAGPTLLRAAGGHPSAASWRTRRVRVGELTIECRLDVGAAALVGWEGEPPFDWHALLCGGALSIQVGQVAVVLAGGLPVRGLRDLLVGLRAAVAQVRGGPAPVRRRGASVWTLTGLAPDRPHGGASATPRDHRLTFAGDEGSLQAEVCLEHLVRAALRVGQAVLEDLVAANPAITRNERFCDLASHLRDLEVWHRDLVEGDLTLEDDDPRATASADVRVVACSPVPHSGPPREATFPFAMSQVRRLGLQRRWLRGEQALNFEAVSADHETAVLSARRGLFAVELADGTIRWTFEERGVEDFVELGDELLVRGPAGELHALVRLDGRRRWTAPAGTCARGVLLRALRYAAAGRDHLVVVSASGRVCALDAATGRPLGTLDVGHGELVGAIGFGELCAVVSDDGFAYGVEAATSRLRWRCRLGTGTTEHATCAAGQLVTIDVDRVADVSCLAAVDLRTGRLRWRATVPGRPLGPAHVLDGDLILAQTHADQTLIVAIDHAAGHPRWQHTVEGAGAGLLVWPDADRAAAIFARTDAHRLLALDARGQRLWLTAPLIAEGDVAVHNLPLAAAAGALVATTGEVCLVDPRTGRLLHRLAGLPAHPAFLMVTPDLRFLVGEPADDGQRELHCYGVEHFLAVVK